MKKHIRLSRSIQRIERKSTDRATGRRKMTVVYRAFVRGKHLPKALTRVFPRKSDAVDWADELKTHPNEALARARGHAQDGDGGPLTFSRLCDLYMRQYVGRDNSRPTRVAWWREFFEDTPVEDLTADDVRRAIHRLDVEPAQRGRRISAGNSGSVPTEARCSNLTTHELTKGSEGPSVSFVSAAYTRFQTWREVLENRLRSDELQPSVESHLAKYRSLIPSLALINQALLESKLREVGVEALEMAIAMGTYLESHAMRIYAPIMHAEVDAARLLARRLRRRQIPSEFAPRDVYRHAWAGLSNPAVVKSAAALLEDFDWLTANRIATPGRTKLVYRVNPRIHE